MIKLNLKQKWATRKMQKQLKQMYGDYMYGLLLAFLLDGTSYFLGNQEEAKIKNITISFNGGKVSTLDLDNEKFYHPEFEEAGK